MPTLHSLLTIIFVTSPLPSHPTVDIIAAVLASHERFCPELRGARQIVVCDGYKVCDAARLKKGRVTAAIGQAYEAYKERVRTLFAESTTFVALDEHVGFALAVRAAMELVTTPYVLVQQHDWAFCEVVPMVEIVAGLEAAGSQNMPVDYLAFNTRRHVEYSDRRAGHVPAFRKLEAMIRQQVIARSHPPLSQLLQDATPLFHWLDRPHLCRASVYSKQVFGHGHFRKGDFIEDVFGNLMLGTIKSRVADWERNQVGGSTATPGGDDGAPSSDLIDPIIRNSGWLGCWLWQGNRSDLWHLVHLQGRTYSKHCQNGQPNTRKLSIVGKTKDTMSTTS